MINVDKIKIVIAKFFEVSINDLLVVTDTQVSCYCDDRFPILSNNLNEEKKRLMFEFCKFYRMQKKFA